MNYDKRPTKSSKSKTKAPISIEFLRSGGFNMNENKGANIIQDIGLIVYKIPFDANVEDRPYEELMAEYKQKVKQTTFDYPSLFASKTYQNYLNNSGKNKRMPMSKRVVIGDYISYK